MAEFSKMVITSKGRELLAKIIAGTSDIKFTKICSSSAEYIAEQLESLTELSDIRQTSPISKVTRENDTSIKVESAFSNADLTSEYYVRSMGLYAMDPDNGEILYGVTIETSGHCHMPIYNGVTSTGMIVKLVTEVGNAENVSLEVADGVYVSVAEFKNHKHTVPHGGTGLTEITTGNFLVGNGAEALVEKTPDEVLGLLGGNKTVVGSYFGTGAYGSPSLLTTIQIPCTDNWEPKCLIVFPVLNNGSPTDRYDVGIIIEYYSLFYNVDSNGITGTHLTVDTSYGLTPGTLTKVYKAFKWYSENSAREQLNEQYMYYFYVAF